MIEIPLSKKGKYAGKYVTIVDDIDKDLAELNWTWNNHRGGYAQIRIAGKKVSMHRMILERMLPHPLEKGQTVDHINGNGLDNRRENLRLATASQNIANSKLRKNNTSGYKGVSWAKRDKKWKSEIMMSRKHIHLGYFDTPEEAHEAYCEKAKELFGEFANFGERR